MTNSVTIVNSNCPLLHNHDQISVTWCHFWQINDRYLSQKVSYDITALSVKALLFERISDMLSCPLFHSDGSNTILSNIDRTRTSFFEHRTNSNMFICWWSNSNTLFFASNELTSNLIGPSLDLLIYLSNIVVQTSTQLKRVHLLVIILDHLNFGFKRTNINYQT